MRAVASYPHVPGSIPGPSVMFVEFVVGSLLAPRGFPRYSCFPLSSKTNFLNSNWIQNPRATVLSVVRLFSATLVKQIQFILFTVNSVLTETLISGQLYLRTPFQIPVNTFYLPASLYLHIPVSGHSRVSRRRHFAK